VESSLVYYPRSSRAHGSWPFLPLEIGIRHFAQLERMMIYQTKCNMRHEHIFIKLPTLNISEKTLNVVVLSHSFFCILFPISIYKPFFCLTQCSLQNLGVVQQRRSTTHTHKTTTNKQNRHFHQTWKRLYLLRHPFASVHPSSAEQTSHHRLRNPPCR
jgi:hypothetical protein